MIKHLKIYLLAFKNTLASRMAYRIDFFISALIMLIFELIMPLITYLIYRSGTSFPGWSFNEVFLIQATFLLSKGITFSLFSGIVFNTIEQVREGTYDLLLLKPRSTLFMTLLTGISIDDLGKLFGGIALFTIAVIHTPPVTHLNWLLFALLFIVSILVFISFTFIMAASGFYWVGNYRVFELFDVMSGFALFPRTIFSKGLQIIITACIPIALMGFYPASVLLGKSLNGLLYSLISSLFFLIFSIWFWHKMLKSYSSAGG